MALIRLSWSARKSLERIAHTDSNGRTVRRAQALLWLHQGESVGAVAHRLGLTRRAIYKIVERYQARSDRPTAERVSDLPHPGRPDHKRQQVMQVVAEFLRGSPSDYGYRAFAWTTPMLRSQVERRIAESVSARTVRRALRDLRYRYKRPRYVLARRSPTWHQAKGGSNAA